MRGIEMPYKFNFDLSRVSKSFFMDVAKFSDRNKVHRKIGNISRNLVQKFRVHDLTGLPVSDAITIVEDLMDIYIKNLSNRESFIKTKKRALFLQHCSRKNMDEKCKASFNKKISSYVCAHCSKDCLINRATKIAEEKNYDVYVLPGGSCVRKILSKRRYEGIVGIACCDEIKMANNYLSEIGIPYQGMPLLRNGCANTKFSIADLGMIL
ncbi:MAG: DUF116 domain-containing protein [Candidatus Aenigmatarchaeota archaeon]